jgi:hypothetical protein
VRFSLDAVTFCKTFLVPRVVVLVVALVHLKAHNDSHKSIEVIPFTANTYVNRCALSDEPMPPLEQQLEELKKFYKK